MIEGLEFAPMDVTPRGLGRTTKDDLVFPTDAAALLFGALIFSVAIFGMNPLNPAVADLFLQRPAPKDEPRQIEKIAQLVGTGPPDQNRGRISHHMKQLFTFAQRFFRAAAPSPRPTGPPRTGPMLKSRCWSSRIRCSLSRRLPGHGASSGM